MQYTIDPIEIGVRLIWEKPKLLECYVIRRDVLTKQLIERLFLDKEKTKEQKENVWIYRNFVYCLFNDDEGRKDCNGNPIKRKFYVGKTTDLSKRQDDHKDKKDWWNHIILFTEKDYSFEESDIGAIERILYERFVHSKMYELTNAQHPHSPVKDYHGGFVDYILSMLEHVGYELDEVEETSNTEEYAPESDESLLNKVKSAIAGINKTIVAEPKSVYIAYSMMQGQSKKMLCTVAPKMKGTYCRIEFYSTIDNVSVKHDFLKKEQYLHNRGCSMNVYNEKDIKNMLSILRDIIGYKPSIGASKQGKRGNFKFSMIGIKPGEKLVFKRDESIVCIVKNDTQVVYNGENYSLSALAGKLRNLKNNPQGPNEFKYKGKILEDLRKEIYGK